MVGRDCPEGEMLDVDLLNRDCRFHDILLWISSIFAKRFEEDAVVVAFGKWGRDCVFRSNDALFVVAGNAVKLLYDFERKNVIF